MNVPVYFPAMTVVATDDPQVESTSGFKPTRLCVCSIKEGAVLRSVNRMGLGLVFKPWDVAQWMLKVSRSLLLSWSISSPLPCAAQGCLRPGETWHAPQQRDDETPQWAFKGDNTTRVVTWIAPVERHR